MSKSHATPAAGPQSATTTTAPAAKAPDAQDLVGNAALSESVEMESEEEESLLDHGPTEQSAAPTQGAKGDGKHRGPTGPAKKQAEQAADKPADPASRPSRFKKGMSGALVGDGKDIPLLASAEAGAATVATVSDGAACSVLEYTATHVKVKARVGDKNKEGWVLASLFSDQPALANDEDDKKLKQDLEYNLVPGVKPPEEGDKPTSQGGLGDCFFIASLAALHFANPEFTKGMIEYDPKTKRYTVTFHEQVSKGRFEPVEITVDGFLPTPKSDPTDPAYAGDANEPLWGAIVEKAYAKWKGGYHVLDEGGNGADAMQEMTGVKSTSKNISSMSEKDVVPFFQKAQEDGLAIYAGVMNSVEQQAQTPLSGSAEGPYTGTIKQPHEWNEVEPGSLRIADKGKGGVGEAWDEGSEGDKEGSIAGDHVKTGKVGYKDSNVSVTYEKGKKPADGKDLELTYSTHGVLLPSKMLIGNHAYAFDKVVGDQLQFYNPWGSWQPKPITAAEFLTYFDSLATNQIPKAKTGGN